MAHAMTTMLEEVGARARSAGVFGEIRLEPDRLACAAPEAAAEAWYRVERDGDSWHVSFVTPDRWLSESIEADLMHTGDPIEELVEEELVELGAPAGRPRVEHFRSDDMLYTFRTPLRSRDGAADFVHEASTLLLAYEAAFRELGDVVADDEND